MTTPTRGPSVATRFVAYVYPGWHADPYRPGIDEWDLLDNFTPYFHGHERPPRPQHGPYDDSDATTAEAQVSAATASGVVAFLYFTYYGTDGFVMSSPMEAAFYAASRSGNGFAIAGSWCVRLPHDRFPVEPRDNLAPPQLPRLEKPNCLRDKPIELLTLSDLEELLGVDDEIWNEFVLTGQ